MGITILLWVLTLSRDQAWRGAQRQVCGHCLSLATEHFAMCWPFVSLWAEFSFAFCAVRERRDRMAEQTLIAFFALSSAAFHELCVPEASGPQRERGGGESSSMRLVLDLSSIFCFICVLCASLRLSSTRKACFTAAALLHLTHSIVSSHWQYWSKKIKVISGLIYWVTENIYQCLSLVGHWELLPQLLHRAQGFKRSAVCYANFYMWPWTTKPVLSSTGIFVAIANNTLYGSIFLLCQRSLGY